MLRRASLFGPLARPLARPCGPASRSAAPEPGRSLSRFALALVLLVPLMGACGSQSPATPRSAADAYAEALEEGRLDEAYDLLSAETRQELSREAFVALVGDNPREVETLARALRQKAGASEIRATLTTSDGQVLELVLEDGAWRLEASALSLYPQDTPELALASFVRAYDARRWDVLLRFVPEDQLEGLDAAALRAAWEGEQREEIETVVAGLRASLEGGRVEVLGDRATMSYAAEGTVELILEQGAWKVEDFR